MEFSSYLVRQKRTTLQEPVSDLLHPQSTAAALKILLFSCYLCSAENRGQPIMAKAESRDRELDHHDVVREYNALYQ